MVSGRRSRHSLAGLPRAALVAVAAAGGFAPVSAQEARAELGQWGITWRLEEPRPCGRYANGDWWVVGPAAVAAVTPAPGAGRHGSMRNPRAGRRGREVGQAFDDRVALWNPDAGVSWPCALEPGDSLVSAASRPDDRPRPGPYADLRSRGVLRTAAVLTCVAEPPPPGSFRPPWCGTARPHTTAELAWELLPGIRPQPGSPDPAVLRGALVRPWLDHLPGWEMRALHPYESMPDYGRDIALLLGEAGLVLLQDRPRAQLEALMIAYVQLGIDLWGMVGDGQEWWADGGHHLGRKWPIVFAGLMLGDEDMQRPGHGFSEDLQTWTGEGWTGDEALFRFRPGADHELRHPSEWDATDRKHEKYRRCCTSIGFVGHALAARLMGAEELWGHPPFFAYVDRWMEPMQPAHRAAVVAVLGGAADRYPHGHAGTDLVRETWVATRGGAGAVAPRER